MVDEPHACAERGLLHVGEFAARAQVKVGLDAERLRKQGDVLHHEAVRALRVAVHAVVVEALPAEHHALPHAAAVARLPAAEVADVLGTALDGDPARRLGVRRERGDGRFVRLLRLAARAGAIQRRAAGVVLALDVAPHLPVVGLAELQVRARHGPLVAHRLLVVQLAGVRAARLQPVGDAVREVGLRGEHDLPWSLLAGVGAPAQDERRGDAPLGIPVLAVVAVVVRLVVVRLQRGQTLVVGGKRHDLALRLRQQRERGAVRRRVRRNGRRRGEREEAGGDDESGRMRHVVLRGALHERKL